MGGTLGAFLARTAGRAAVRRVLDLFGDQYIDLSQPAPPTARHSAQQASPSSASVTQPASDQPPPNVGVAVSRAPTP